jgi:hypothetical protein
VDELSGGQAGKPWTRFEIEATVVAYFSMFRRQLRGERFTKAAVIRELNAQIPARTADAIQYKFGNISAVLKEDDEDWLGGFAPYPNSQGELRETVRARRQQESRIAELLAEYGEGSLIAPQPRPLATSDVVVPVPGPRGARGRSRVDIVGSRTHALREFKNKALGDAGEEWVRDLEQTELVRFGRRDLADLVRWVAREDGDGLGYDVGSFFPDGRPRLIEVKTTHYSALTPFFITQNEVDTSEQHPDAYSLYRVHGFGRDPRVYVLDGMVRDRADLHAYVYRGLPLPS